MAYQHARGRAGFGLDDPEGMLGAEDDRIAAVEPEGDPRIYSFPLDAHLDRAKGGRFDLDVELLDRRDEHMASVGLAPENSREQADHRRAPDRASFVIPGSIAGDAHARMPAPLGIPLVHRRHATLGDQLLKLGKAQSLQFNRGAALRHRLH